LYRIASISKVYTGLALLRLQDKIDKQVPVTNYLPELKELVKE
jgi:CubicO group peptidase (beta-lactamase class C family)